MGVQCEGAYIHKFNEKLRIFEFSFFFTIAYCEKARNGHCNVNLAAIILVDSFRLLLARFPLRGVCLWRGTTVVCVLFLMRYLLSVGAVNFQVQI